MKLFRYEKPKADHAFTGTWHIYEMELWDAGYFNKEVQAFVKVQPDNIGDFQFGLVSGYLDGYVEEEPETQFVFTWEGQDEMDPASGSGWMRLHSEDEVEGLIKFHAGDRSAFKAKRAD